MVVIDPGFVQIFESVDPLIAASFLSTAVWTAQSVIYAARTAGQTVQAVRIGKQADQTEEQYDRIGTQAG